MSADRNHMLRITGHFRSVAPERIGTSIVPNIDPEEITIEEAATVILEAATDLPALLQELHSIANKPHRHTDRKAGNAWIVHKPNRGVSSKNWGSFPEGWTRITFQDTAHSMPACVIISADGSKVDSFLAAIAANMV